MFKKKKIVFILLLSTCFLVLLIILSSKILTIKSSSIETNLDKQVIKTHKGLEMEKVRENYLSGIQALTADFELSYNSLEALFTASSTSIDYNERLAQITKIKDIQNSLTALLVPPEYRKQHLKLVLDFQKIDPQLGNAELLNNLKLILLDLKGN